METTLTIAKHFNMTPFEVFKTDVDAVIMIINHFIAKGEKENNTPPEIMSEREESAAFWAAL
jgi:hypothetical protein